jgi:hypothetical protein
VQSAGEVPPRRWLVIRIGACCERIGEVEVQLQLPVAALELIITLTHALHTLRLEDGVLLQKRHS